MRTGRSFKEYTLHARNSFLQSIHSSYATIMIGTTKFIAMARFFFSKLKMHTSITKEKLTAVAVAAATVVLF